MLDRVILNGLLAGLGYALAGTGFSLWHRVGGYINIAYPVPIVLAPYLAVTTFYVTQNHLFAAVFSVFLAGLTAAALESRLISLIRTRGAGPLVLLLSSVGILMVFESIIALCYGEAPRDIRPEALGSAITLFGLPVELPRALLALAGLLAAVALSLLLRHTSTGVTLAAVAENPQLSAVFGIRVSRAREISALLAGATGGLYGLLLAYDTHIVPTMGFEILLVAATVSIAGSIMPPPGILFAGLSLGVVEHLAVWMLEGKWRNSIFFLFLLVFLLFPKGKSKSRQKAF